MTAGPNQAAPKAAWWVQIRGQAYGPYTEKQMQGFVAEGRVKAQTLISLSADGDWREARTIPGMMAHASANRSFAAAPAAVPANEAPASAAKSAPEAANIFVFAEIHSGAWTRFMAALEGMGLVVDMAPGLWLVRTRHTSSVVRNTLSQTLEQGDRFIVIDASRDRLAWFNLGPEVDVHIKGVWNQDAPQKAR